MHADVSGYLMLWVSPLQFMLCFLFHGLSLPFQKFHENLFTAFHQWCWQANQPTNKRSKTHVLGGDKNTENITELTPSTDQCGVGTGQSYQHTLQFLCLNTCAVRHRGSGGSKRVVKEGNQPANHYYTHQYIYIYIYMGLKF